MHGFLSSAEKYWESKFKWVPQGCWCVTNMPYDLLSPEVFSNVSSMFVLTTENVQRLPSIIPRTLVPWFLSETLFASFEGPFLRKVRNEYLVNCGELPDAYYIPSLLDSLIFSTSFFGKVSGWKYSTAIVIGSKSVFERLIRLHSLSYLSYLKLQMGQRIVGKTIPNLNGDVERRRTFKRVLGTRVN